MATIFKYMKSKYAKDFLSGEVVQVGTLSGFRQTESRQSAIGDIDEGTYRVQSSDPAGTTRLDDTFFQTFMPFATGLKASNVTSRESPNLIVYEDFDAFIFCTATVLDWTLCAKLCRDYDCAISIPNPIKLRRRLAKGLEHKGAQIRGWTHGEVIYKNRFQLPDRPLEGYPSPMMKNEECDWMKEYRHVWLTAPPVMRLVPQRVSIDTVGLDLQLFRKPGS